MRNNKDKTKGYRGSSPPDIGHGMDDFTKDARSIEQDSEGSLADQLLEQRTESIMNGNDQESDFGSHDHGTAGLHSEDEGHWQDEGGESE
jgi:hypothetical protein